MYLQELDDLSSRVPSFTFSRTGFPHIPKDTDVVIIPAEKLSMLNIPALAVRNIPVLAYGESSQLRKSYLSGCRDYIRIPITSDELYFRILQAVSKREHRLSWDTLTISTGYITDGDRSVTLSYQQFLVLRLLLTRRNTPVPRITLQYLLWGEVRPGSRDVDMHIAALRRKLLQFNSGNEIKTITGLGYMIEDLHCG